METLLTPLTKLLAQNFGEDIENGPYSALLHVEMRKMNMYSIYYHDRQKYATYLLSFVFYW